jgi:hypothetical protein
VENANKQNKIRNSNDSLAINLKELFLYLLVKIGETAKKSMKRIKIIIPRLEPEKNICKEKSSNDKE